MLQKLTGLTNVDLNRYLKSPEMPAECYAETRSLNYVLLEQDNGQFAARNNTKLNVIYYSSSVLLVYLSFILSFVCNKSLLHQNAILRVDWCIFFISLFFPEDESSACMDVFSRLSVTRTTCRF